MIITATRILFVLGLVVVGCRCAIASEPSKEWLDPRGISGKLVICGGGELPDSVLDKFVELAGGESARLVVIPTASEKAEDGPPDDFVRSWREAGIKDVQVLHTRSKDEANSSVFVEPLKQATAIWLVGGQQSRIAEAYVGTAVEREVSALLERGGVIGGTSAGAAIQSRLMIARGNPMPEVATGFDLLPGCVIDQHFSKRNRKPRLLKVLAEHAGYLGCGVDEQTALIVDGRRLSVLGENSVTLLLAASADREVYEMQVKEGDIADLTALRRAARDRAGSAFPPNPASDPIVKSGSLILGGGGGMPQEVVEKFIELAGGTDASIVVLPTAAEPIPERVSEVRMLERSGATNLTVLRQKTRDEVESDDFRAVLKSASGVWFCGGRQWRFVDAYENTGAFDLFHAVLDKGGVIGGSSAGASIQAEYLARGNPIGNRDIMAAGYERGFGFLPGVAVDQHFAQRDRFKDMMSLVEAFPQVLGIGIDESTAVLVQGHAATVMGKNEVHFFDRNQPIKEGEPDYITLKSAQSYDFKARRVVK